MTDVQSVKAVPGAMPTGGRWGWYQDGLGNEYRRVSTLIKKVETDRDALDKWLRRQVLEGAAIRDDIVLGVKAMGRPGPGGWSREQRSDLDKLAETAMAAAKQTDGATTGTAVHTLTERVDRGEPVEQVIKGLPAAAAHDVMAYVKLRELNGWVNIEVERTVVNDQLEVAGTFDRVDVVPGLAALLRPGDCQYGHSGNHAGTVPAGSELAVVVDVKTEKDPTFNGLHIGPQLAIYSRSTRMWIPGQGYVPAPCVRQDVAIVVHVRDGKAVPLFVNLTEGWEAALAAKAQLDRESRARRRMGVTGSWFVPVPRIREPRPAEILSSVATVADYANPQRPSLATALVDASHAATATTELVATPRADGMVDWQPSGGLDEVDRGAIKVIWAAGTLEELGTVWTTYTSPPVGRPWGGRVAEAAGARRRQIECPHRSMHSPATTSKCACGWTREVAP